MSILEEQEFHLDTEKMASNSRYTKKEQLTWSLMIYGGGGWKGRKTSKLIQYFIVHWWEECWWHCQLQVACGGGEAMLMMWRTREGGPDKRDSLKGESMHPIPHNAWWIKQDEFQEHGDDKGRAFSSFWGWRSGTNLRLHYTYKLL